ncbi:KH domain-containing protein [Cylindrospermopsis raciborskii]|uniref:KH domain-containing protein n=1 Tax=Cylindrospermopsis raciborskii TaxID=77022 RepID=UPI0008DE1A49|nr:KH domain-containing protein [Cylindrospermopsis raciborskii]OHY32596.1 KH domain-containing protein [Cylindrospermopsis raciborskii CS-508]
MFLNKSVPTPHHHKLETKLSTTSPNYTGLVRFLVEPFLDSPGSLRIDCEMSNTLKRAWIRIAFDPTDKGKVLGRGGRNIQAIRTVVTAAAELAGQSVYLDIYGNNSHSPDGSDEEEKIFPPKSRSGNTPGSFSKPRFRR